MWVSYAQVSITFPTKHSIANGGYEFQNVLINGETKNENIISLYTDRNYDIVANYQRQIQVTVNDGNGGGIYPYGTSIIVTAPEKQKISFLVRDVFDHWVGIVDQKDDTFAMTVTEDMVISAVYREDYSVLMYVVFVGVSVVVVIILKKKNDGYAYRIKNITSEVLGKLAKITDVKKIKIPTKKKDWVFNKSKYLQY